MTAPSASGQEDVDDGQRKRMAQVGTAARGHDVS
jgi:hypothetical protein